MRVLLLQDQVYLPSLGGGNKANRLILEALAARGCRCTVVAPALTSRAGPSSRIEFVLEMARRGVDVRPAAPGVYAFRHAGVDVEALVAPSVPRWREYVRSAIARLRPDRILVSDDKPRILLECAVTASAERTVCLLQTLMHLPFGPLARSTSRRQMRHMRHAGGVVVISRFMHEYLERHAGIDATLMYPPVYGEPPFPRTAAARDGFVTQINPCVEKGLGIFLALAERFPDQAFAAVPTWGTDEATIDALLGRPNVHVVAPADDLGALLGRTRALVAASLWPETFGYVVPEAMLRGIPVLASDIGGLPEAKLGVDYLLPVTPARQRGGRYVDPGQDVEPWAGALADLLGDPQRHARCARESRAAARRFVRGATIEPLVEILGSP